MNASPPQVHAVPSYPVSWRVVPLGYIAGALGGLTPSKDDPALWNGEVPWVTPKDMKSDVIAGSIDHVSELALKSTGLRLVEPPVVLTVVRGMILAHTVPIGLTCIPVTLNQDMKALVPRKGVDARFLSIALRALQDGLLALVEEAGHGTKKLRTDLWTKFMVPVPPLSTQRAIAEFLDKKTVAIDALIAKKERLIELLQEKRQALITQAVTKGLDPNVPMRDSGVEWLGEIPAHWQVLSLTRVVQRFVDYRGRTPEKTDDGVPLITAGAVRNGRIEHSRAPEFVTEEVYRQLNQRGYPEVGDILFTSEAPLGEAGMVEDTHIACAQRIIMFKLDRNVVNPEFLLWYLLSAPGRTEIASRASGSTAEGIRADRLRMAAVLVPPLAEQDLCVEWLRAQVFRSERVEPVLSQHIDLLREYRQALITEAVTGKLDIAREAARDRETVVNESLEAAP